MKTFLFAFVLSIFSFSPLFAQRWPADKAVKWYSNQPWLVGCNYIPTNAINELEMWQAETFDLNQIEKELTWAEGIGFTTLRVFLHDLLWQQDSKGFLKRIDSFLAVCDKHHIKPIFVLFDSVWDPNPTLGKQRNPTPGVHNSGWMQSPGAKALADSNQYPRLKEYVVGIVNALKTDSRVLAWDVWNEPDNVNTNNYDEPKNKFELVEKLLPQAFDWVRSANPQQPITSGVWKIDYSKFKELNAIEKIQLEKSDIISFHSYDDSTRFKKAIVFLKQYGRPIICTEYLARGNKSTFETIMPLGKSYNVGLINWGFVAGKTQTNLPWDSWEKPYTNGRQPAVWHHEIFYPDGKPYKQSEVDFIKRITSKK